MKVHNSFLVILVFFTYILFAGDTFSQTSILKWQDGKDGCVTITFDDGSINQFRYAVPLLNERGLPATFYIITGGLPGSKYHPTFTGRPVQQIIKESGTIPTGKDNLFERCSALYYLAQTGKYPEIKDFFDMSVAVGEQFEQGKLDEVYSIIDKGYAALRSSGHTYNFERKKEDTGTGYHLTWDMLKQLDKEGHEIANHTVSHPYMPVIDKANIMYEIQKAAEDIRTHIPGDNDFSIECPYGIDDERVLEYVYPEFQFVRNGLKDTFIKEILRGDPEEPVSKDKEYVQWQRGGVTETPMSVMKGWVDRSIKDSVWLLLVFHGVEGIGWEPLTKESYAEYFDYIKANTKNVWVATFRDAYKYVRERMNTKVESKTGNDAITVALSNTMDKKIYNIPVTLRTIVPDTWKTVTIKHGKENKKLTVQKEGNISFVQYRAVPDIAEITLTKND